MKHLVAVCLVCIVSAGASAQELQLHIYGVTSWEDLPQTARDSPSSVREVSIALNDYASFPSFLGKFEEVEVLRIGGAGYEMTLPDSWRSAGTLRHLDVNFCWDSRGSRILDSVQRFGGLLSLSIIACHVDPTFDLSSLGELESIKLVSNGLLSPPSGLFGIPGLRRLSYSTNSLPTLPPEFGNLHCLEELYLEGTGLRSLPDNLAGLQKLKEMVIFGGTFDGLPPSFFELKSLRYALIPRVEEYTSEQIARIRAQLPQATILFGY